MRIEKEPEFLTREIVDDLHYEAIEQHGGHHGVLNEHLLESAIHQPQQTYHVGGGDLYEIAAAYAYPSLPITRTGTVTSGQGRWRR